MVPKKKQFRIGSLFNGIGAAPLAWEPLGWKCRYTSEINPFAIRVVEHHFKAENLGDIREIAKETLHGRPIDLLVGGSPCVSFSSLGNRQGMDDPRGELALRFLEVARVAQPRWIVFENVPRLKSSNKGRDFGAFLGMLEKFGYGWAYRTFNARYFGLAQSRERVFVVGYRGDWRRAAAVLFERDSLLGAPSSCKESRQNTPRAAAVDPACGFSTTGSRPRRCIGFHGNAQGCQIASTTRDLWLAATLTASQRAAVAYEVPRPFLLSSDGFNESIHEEGYNNLRAGRDSGDAVAIPTADGGQSWWVVRYLMPMECERLQGFPDGFTQVPDYRGKPAADTPRLKALGNAFPVPVMRWIGERIQMVEEMNITEHGWL